MTPDLRRRLAALLAGVAGTLVALLSATLLRARACRAAGGSWEDAARRCALAAGTPEPSTLVPYLLGALAGLVALVVLWRTYTFFALRGMRSGRDPVPGNRNA
jgi:hypothetical protein